MITQQNWTNSYLTNKTKDETVFISYGADFTNNDPNNPVRELYYLTLVSTKADDSSKNKWVETGPLSQDIFENLDEAISAINNFYSKWDFGTKQTKKKCCCKRKKVK